MAAKKKAMTKSGLYGYLAEHSELSKKQVEAVLTALHGAIKTELGPKGVGILTLPGIARFKVRKVKAVKGGQKKINPLNKQEYVTKDKPAYSKVSILPVKALKEELK